MKTKRARKEKNIEKHVYMFSSCLTNDKDHIHTRITKMKTCFYNLNNRVERQKTNI